MDYCYEVGEFQTDRPDLTNVPSLFSILLIAFMFFMQMCVFPEVG